MPPKKKQTRYDAAYDHLGPKSLGFSRRTIRNKIDSLLKVYGKDDGWVFIEEASYKLLIDCLLEDQEILLLKGPEAEEDFGNNLLTNGSQEEEEEDFGNNLLTNGNEDEDEGTNQQLLRKHATIVEKRITRSSSAARTSSEIDMFEPTGCEPRTEEVKKRTAKKRYLESFLFGGGNFPNLLPAAGKKERSQRKLAGLVASRKFDDGKLVSAQEEKLQEKLTGPVQGAPQYCIRRRCFGTLDSEDDGKEDYVLSETKTSFRERLIREGSVIPREVQRSWWNVVGTR
ncbi:hypothetical protein MKW94_022017 [Papaver nudicaule]|uniref:WIYLD domain-containing protein n=1 Tax=Papaver nudicaule TaxID=74823 RepID=A0AA41RZ03_PAPNU|nr:hypothetical protein [Papaver nudicaule]